MEISVNGRLSPGSAEARVKTSAHPTLTEWWAGVCDAGPSFSKRWVRWRTSWEQPAWQATWSARSHPQPGVAKLGGEWEAPLNGGLDKGIGNRSPFFVIYRYIACLHLYRSLSTYFITDPLHAVSAILIMINITKTHSTNLLNFIFIPDKNLWRNFFLGWTKMFIAAISKVHLLCLPTHQGWFYVSRSPGWDVSHR